MVLVLGFLVMVYDRRRIERGLSLMSLRVAAVLAGRPARLRGHPLRRNPAVPGE